MQQVHSTPGGMRSFGAGKSSQVTLSTRHGVHPHQPFRPLPPPTGAMPYRLSLESVLPPACFQQITATGKLVFHAVGDTGGVQHATPQRIVAQQMVSDLHAANAAFFYHLGDVVYYNGQASGYYEQFYDPYVQYDAPIFAIPGNHDGDPLPDEASLAAFVNNFCAPTPRLTQEAGEVSRHAMTQPHVYWTLEAPYATIIGLYTNVPGGGQLDNDQLAWLHAEMRSAPPDKALIIAMHHPVYSADIFHSGSRYMGQILDEAITASGRVPDLVLSGHVHNYQRFTRQLTAAQGEQREIPFLVAGAGGYFHLHAEQAPSGQRVSVGHTVFEQAGQVKLETYCTDRHGFLRIEVSEDTITGTYLTVPRSHEAWNGPVTAFDTFTLDLKTHLVH